MRKIILIALVLSSFVARAQQKKHSPQFSISELTFMQPEFNFRVWDKEGSKCLDMEIYGETYQTIGHIVNGKIIAIAPFKIRQDTCRQTLTIVNTKLKRSFTYRYNKETIFLTGLKLQ